jgi:type IV secretion system protein VirD4
VLFLLDEARFLGRLPTLAAMMTADRKYGATVVTLWQDESDQKAIWKDRAGIFAANSSWTIYAAINDLPTAEKVSVLAGKYTVITRTTGSGTSTGDSTSSHNRSSNDGLSESARELIKPEEVRTMRADEAIVFRRGAAPIRCGRAIFFRRDDMLDRVAADRLRRVAIAAE